MSNEATAKEGVSGMKRWDDFNTGEAIPAPFDWTTASAEEKVRRAFPDVRESKVHEDPRLHGWEVAVYGPDGKISELLAFSFDRFRAWQIAAQDDSVLELQRRETAAQAEAGSGGVYAKNPLAQCACSPGQVCMPCRDAMNASKVGTASPDPQEAASPDAGGEQKVTATDLAEALRAMVLSARDQKCGLRFADEVLAKWDAQVLRDAANFIDSVLATTPPAPEGEKVEITRAQLEMLALVWCGGRPTITAPTYRSICAWLTQQIKEKNDAQR